MVLFGRKKEASVFREETPVFSEPISFQEPEQEKEPQEVEKPTFAPLFVKIDRYKQILDSINELKTDIQSVRSAFRVLNEIERLEEQNMNMVGTILEKIEKKLLELDSQFLRPPEFEQKPMYPREDIESPLSDLKNQIHKLKTELQSIA